MSLQASPFCTKNALLVGDRPRTPMPRTAGGGAMKRKSSLSLGPGASSLILIFVVLSMSILGMLSLLTARNDLNLSL